MVPHGVLENQTISVIIVVEVCAISYLIKDEVLHKVEGEVVIRDKREEVRERVRLIIITPAIQNALAEVRYKN